MRMSCLPVSLYADLSAGRRSLADWFRFAAELGLDGADISVAHLPGRDATSLAPLRRQAEDAGVAIPMLVTYTDFTHPDPAVRAAQADELRSCIEAATHLGVGYLRVTAGQNHPGVQRDEGIAWACAGLTACVEEARTAGIVLAYENHTIGYGWTHYDFSLPADIYLEIVGRTAGSGLQLLFDTANNLVNSEDPLPILAQVIDRVAVIHAADMARKGVFEPTVAGSGVSPLAAIFRLFHQHGFDGWLSVEEGSKTGEEGFRQAIPAVRSLWHAAALSG
ncbi:MAG: sugar phosphate isomerase/epimerase [Caldilineaceae bacterium]|nr:sugar phosphate isomerase/epimerase [Caldilineaceae bacterium]HRJ44029.1 sugar phosphate isomerase/epimerase family protein [Caldilineaceae bacterium]